MQTSIGSLKGKKALVIGLGISGRSAAAFLLNQHAHVYAADDKLQEIKNRPEILQLVEKGLFLIKENEIPQPDFVVLSPGVPMTHPLIVLAHKNNWEIIGEIELACRYLSQPMLGITGTNGKTTVTLLTAHVLNQSGIPARALGNSGIPLTSVFEKALKSNEMLVLELSSYQLETLHVRCLDAAVLLNITPDHLDRYHSMKEYAAAKLRVSSCLKTGGQFFAEESCASQYPSLNVFSYGYHTSSTIYTDLTHVYKDKILQFSLPENLQGKRSHDIENLMGSYALCSSMGVTAERFAAAYSTFVKLPHRIEFVRTHRGISYINDSKGTNLDAVIRAVGSIDGKIVLIAGGVDKGASYTAWLNAFAGKVRCICAIGESAKKIETELGNDIPIRLYKSLSDAVYAAAHVAKPGETVLLSPGCSSYDMFKDYEHRGDEFKRLVEAL